MEVFREIDGKCFKGKMKCVKKINKVINKFNYFLKFYGSNRFDIGNKK